MRRIAVALALLSLASGTSAAATPETGYLAPRFAELAVEPGAPPVTATFPVARTEWLSLINFADDWHAPRMRKVDGRWRQVGVHEGNDIFAEPGTPVRAVVAGRVERVGWTFYSGWRVGIRDASGRYWFYAHLSSFADGTVEGRQVEAGTHIGNVGNTGYGSDPGHSDEFIDHLHIGIQRRDGRWIDPYPLMRSLYKVAVRQR